MAALLTFHLLGLYPVQSTTQLLIGSPFLSSYSIKNPLFGTDTNVTVKNFDKSTLTMTPPAGSNIYVQSITINGVVQDSICWIDWSDVLGGGDIVIEVGPDASIAKGCGIGSNARPSSLEAGGFPI